MLPVPGAELYYETRGTGPVLLLIPGGNGDAGPFAPLSQLLADRFTVVTYDRRGFSRSPLRGDVPADRLATDTADVIALLDAVAPPDPVAQAGAGSPRAHILGSSSGAIVALDVLARHPDRIATCVAHEPPLISVLPDRDEWAAFFDTMVAIYRAEGTEVAMAVFNERMGMTGGALPDAATLPPHVREMVERMLTNQRFWFDHELLQYPSTELDFDALATHRDALVLAGGRESRDLMPYQPNLVIAARLGRTVVDFTGDHIGYATHPVEFAAELAAVLRA
jgi:pimeloyl-ACP methyl ester carboxylesterase